MGASWYIRRLKAMTPGEVGHRVSQKALQKRERRAFAQKAPVYKVKAYGSVPQGDLSLLGLNLCNRDFSIGTEIELLGPYDYAEYKTRWHAAFQTDGDWPVRFAHDYAFGAEDVPGDIRTNWELNRHYQFALLAKSFYATGEPAYLDELEGLFESWNTVNPFMWGPEWASPMESAIRLINWLVAARFLEAAPSGEPRRQALVDKLCAGAHVMAANVRKHYSRYSSANNHTVVEASGVAVAAVVFGRGDWLDEALALLEREVALQTWPDGVNKEQALHYQLFVMEALCLVSHVLRASGRELPESIVSSLRNMARYAAVCRVGERTCIEFGDDDEGVVFNPCGKKPFYPGYVLAFASLEVGSDVRWSDELGAYEQLRWLYSPGDFSRTGALSLFIPGRVETFPQGGVTIARVFDGRAVLAFDHGPLGFGELAAHGHADALSVQLYVDGGPVLIDPGTYIYNGDRAARDLFRSTAMHNTVCLNGENQSEILGPFLWGRKAKVDNFKTDESGDVVTLSAVHNGYGSTLVQRQMLIKDSKIVIEDLLSGPEDKNAVSQFHFSHSELEVVNDTIEMPLSCGGALRIATSKPMRDVEFYFSPMYGYTTRGFQVAAPVTNSLITTITLLDR